MSTANDCYYTMNYRMTTVMMPPVLLSSTPSLTTSRSSSENCEQYTMLGLNNAILVLILYAHGTCVFLERVSKNQREEEREYLL